MDPFDIEPSPEEQAAAIVAALRQRSMGNANLAVGGRHLRPLGMAQVQQADRDMGRQQDAQQFGLLQALKKQQDEAKAPYREAQVEAMTTGADYKRQRLDFDRERMKAGHSARLEKRELDAAKRSQDTGEGLRKEVMGNPVTKDTQTVAAAYQKMVQASKVPSAAGDMSMIFSYMKLLDPGSTVREGEYANAQNAAGIDQRIVAMYNRAKEGQLLSPEQRADFLNQGKNLYSAQVSRYRPMAEQYKGLAQRQGARPEDVVLDLGLEPEAAPSPPTGQAKKRTAAEIRAELEALKKGTR